MMTLNSSGLVAELYPDSLGDYHLLPDISYNHHPVFQHSDENGLHIINNGIYLVFYISSLNHLIHTGNIWFLTNETFNSGLRLMRDLSNLKAGGEWQFNKYPNCVTRR